MKNNGRVQGGINMAQPIIVTKYWVYVHINIVELPKREDELEDTSTIYEYDEIQYSTEEYIQLMAEQNQQLNDVVDMLIVDSLEAD